MYLFCVYHEHRQVQQIQIYISISNVKIPKTAKQKDKQRTMLGVNILHFVYFASL